MLPLRDSQPSKRFPLITIILIAVNVLVFFYQATLSDLDLYLFFDRYSFTSQGMLDAFRSGQLYWPLITSMFLHGGVSHLIGNMWILWLFGDNVEDYLRPVRYLLFYIGTGLIATFAHALSDLHSDIFTLGASGAISGVMGAYLVLYPQARILTLIPFVPYFVNIPAYIYLVLWIVLQFASSLLVGGSEGIAWWAHIAGFLAGLLLCIGGRNRRRRKQAGS